MTAEANLELQGAAMKRRSTLRLGVLLVCGLLSLLFALMIVAQSHTMSYVDEATGDERTVECGSMLAPTDLPDDVPAQHARSCDPVSTRNVLSAAGFALLGGIVVWSAIDDLRMSRKGAVKNISRF